MIQKSIVFFGDKATAVKPVTVKQQYSVAQEPFCTLARTHALESLIFPYQVHGTAGLVVDAQNFKNMRAFAHDADWIITNVPGVGVGILTADCVPLLVHDIVSGAAGAIHAGWRGAVDGVVIQAFEAMTIQFGSKPSDIQVFVGPHARTCCYQVNQKFYDSVMQKQFGKNSWHENESALFFDLYHCCLEQLKQAGVPHSAVTDIGICTVCTPAYCSYRREKENALRNVSIIYSLW